MYLDRGRFRFPKHTHSVCTCAFWFSNPPHLSYFFYPSRALLKLLQNPTSVSFSGHKTLGTTAFEAKFLPLVGSRVELSPNLPFSSPSNWTRAWLFFSSLLSVSLITSVNSLPNFSEWFRLSFRYKLVVERAKSIRGLLPCVSVKPGTSFSEGWETLDKRNNEMWAMPWTHAIYVSKHFLLFQKYLQCGFQGPSPKPSWFSWVMSEDQQEDFHRK